jgi:outer membrane immunogenic protein
MRSIVLAAAVVIGLASAASAADQPIKAPMLSPAPVNWTGLYLGAHVGAGWGTVESNISAGGITFPLSSHGTNGMLGGLQGGYNWQTGWVVLGIEGDWSWSGIKGTAPCLVIGSCTTNTKWLASVSGRVGGVVANNTLLYVKGGGVWGRDDYSANFLGLAATSASSTRTGYLFGTGAEYKFTDKWSGLIEYNYMDFGNQSVPFTAGGVTTNVNITDRIHAVKVGLNYKFM